MGKIIKGFAVIGVLTLIAGGTLFGIGLANAHLDYVEQHSHIFYLGLQAQMDMSLLLLVTPLHPGDSTHPFVSDQC